MIVKPDFKLAASAYAYSDVWEIEQAQGIDHPAPFPQELPRRCISSIGDGIILDPFIGSGTTALAAIELGRPWIGIEKSQKYCDYAEERIRLNSPDVEVGALQADSSYPSPHGFGRP
jgi:site-specific DNA-methyltransferase (adenine-specific)